MADEPSVQEPEPEPAADAKAVSAPAEVADFNPEQEYMRLRAQCASLNAQVSATQQEHHEHKLVETAMLPLPLDRKCFRLIGSVLVERTAAEVLPQIQVTPHLPAPSPSLPSPSSPGQLSAGPPPARRPRPPPAARWPGPARPTWADWGPLWLGC